MFDFATSVAARGEVELHGWVYDIKTGAVDAYDPDQDRFVSIEERYGLGG